MSVLLLQPSITGAGAPPSLRRRARKLRYGTTIRVARRYRATPARVFEAWLDPRIAREWLFATAGRPMAYAQIDPRVNGSFRLVEERHGGCVEHCGTYTRIVSPRHLEFTLTSFDLPQAITRVAARIASVRRGCEVVVIHDNVPPGNANQVRARWTGILYGLDAALAASSH